MACCASIPGPRNKGEDALGIDDSPDCSYDMGIVVSTYSRVTLLPTTPTSGLLLLTIYSRTVLIQYCYQHSIYWRPMLFGRPPPGCQDFVFQHQQQFQVGALPHSPRGVIPPGCLSTCGLEVIKYPDHVEKRSCGALL